MTEAAAETEVSKVEEREVRRENQAAYRELVENQDFWDAIMHHDTLEETSEGIRTTPLSQFNADSPKKAAIQQELEYLADVVDEIRQYQMDHPHQTARDPGLKSLLSGIPNDVIRSEIARKLGDVRAALRRERTINTGAAAAEGLLADTPAVDAGVPEGPLVSPAADQAVGTTVEAPANPVETDRGPVMSEVAFAEAVRDVQTGDEIISSDGAVFSIRSVGVNKSGARVISYDTPGGSWSTVDTHLVQQFGQGKFLRIELHHAAGTAAEAASSVSGEARADTAGGGSGDGGGKKPDKKKKAPPKREQQPVKFDSLAVNALMFFGKGSSRRPILVVGKDTANEIYTVADQNGSNQREVSFTDMAREARGNVRIVDADAYRAERDSRKQAPRREQFRPDGLNQGDTVTIGNVSYVVTQKKVDAKIRGGGSYTLKEAETGKVIEVSFHALKNQSDSVQRVVPGTGVGERSSVLAGLDNVIRAATVDATAPGVDIAGLDAEVTDVTRGTGDRSTGVDPRTLDNDLLGPDMPSASGSEATLETAISDETLEQLRRTVPGDTLVSSTGSRFRIVAKNQESDIAFDGYFDVIEKVTTEDGESRNLNRRLYFAEVFAPGWLDHIESIIQEYGEMGDDKKEGASTPETHEAFEFRPGDVIKRVTPEVSKEGFPQPNWVDRIEVVSIGEGENMYLVRVTRQEGDVQEIQVDHEYLDNFASDGMFEFMPAGDEDHAAADTAPAEAEEADDSAENGEEDEVPEERYAIPTEGKYSEVWLTSEFAKYNITFEELEALPQYASLSAGQRLLLLENFKQMVLGRVEEEAAENYKKKTAEAGMLGRLGRYFTKHFHTVKEKKSSYEQITKGGIAEHGEMLRALVAGMAEAGPEVSVRDGRLEVLYVGEYDFERPLTEDEQGQVAAFNAIATDFARMPYEWSLETATKKQQGQFAAIHDHYARAQADMLKIFIETQGPGEATLALNKINEHIQLNQFLNQRPEVERALQNIESPNFWLEALKTPLSRESAIAIGGFAARSTTANLLGAVWTIPAAAGIGSISGYLRSKAQLRDIDVFARKGIDVASDQNLRRSVVAAKKDRLLYKEKPGLAEGVEGSPVDAAAAEGLPSVAEDPETHPSGLIFKLDHLIALADGTMASADTVGNEELEKKERAIVTRLKSRIDYTNSRLKEGLVNFGQGSDSIYNKYALMEALSRAQGLVAAAEIDEVHYKKVEVLLNNALDAKDAAVDEARRKYRNRQILVGAGISAGMAAAGIVAREVFGLLTHHDAGIADAHGAEAPGQSGAAGAASTAPTEQAAAGAGAAHQQTSDELWREYGLSSPDAHPAGESFLSQVGHTPEAQAAAAVKHAAEQAAQATKQVLDVHINEGENMIAALGRTIQSQGVDHTQAMKIANALWAKNPDQWYNAVHAGDTFGV